MRTGSYGRGRTALIWILAVVALAVVCVALLVWLNLRGETAVDERLPRAVASQQTLQRGAYLARVGNCAGCHTTRGGAAYAGGRGIDTPFGVVYSSNITPDPVAGIGQWSADHFWRALHHGRSRDGRLLYPAFPYTDYTRVTREDADALYAFLRSLPASPEMNRPHDLRFPYNTQVSLAVWRALFFSPGVYREDSSRSAEWNRGAYLVGGLGHCQACHAPRNAMGATAQSLDLSGGLIPMQNWYAPSLRARAEAGVQDWRTDDVVRLLRDGRTQRGAALGPMAEVVFASTQHWSEPDLRAMAHFLQNLPALNAPRRRTEPVPSDMRTLGARLYKAQCAECHGEQGEGNAAYLPLAGNRTVTMGSSANLVKIIVNGGFAPTTAGHPRPYGMPPFGPSLSNAEIAAVASFVRNAWGNDAGHVSELDVFRVR